mmetsp:Transcript_22861/g.58138  ORF Transcript_22861/g.58138 Transcript_22861/m.58138 type:complete len:213 (+) Transcript_22861:3-641(+)
MVQHRRSSLSDVVGAAAFFALGVLTHAWITSSGASAPPPPPGRGVYEERGPPTKQELGNAGWTLLHTIAANFPEQPSSQQRARADAFFHALGHLFPCSDCASHFRKHTKLHPVMSESRAALSVWLCEAHNEVNVRNGKEAYYCDIGVLDARWKDCGCGGNASSPETPTSSAAVMPATPTTLDSNPDHSHDALPRHSARRARYHRRLHNPERL